MAKTRYFIVEYARPKGEVSARFFGDRVFHVSYFGTKSNLNRYIKRLKSLYHYVEYTEVGNSNYNLSQLDFD
uniref:Phage protein n=1 Tax=Dulem virus 263 TaxID=3145740 RepID=A0AAU8AXX8_9VIRU